MQCSKRAVCFYLIGTPYETKMFRVDAHPCECAKAHSFVTLPVVFAPIIFAENMVRCTEITTGEDLGVTGFGFGNRLRGCKNENQRTVRIQPDKKEKYV